MRKVVVSGASSLLLVEWRRVPEGTAKGCMDAWVTWQEDQETVVWIGNREPMCAERLYAASPSKCGDCRTSSAGPSVPFLVRERVPHPAEGVPPASSWPLCLSCRSVRPSCRHRAEPHALCG